MAPRGKTTQLHNMFVADFETGDTDILDHIDKKTGQKIYEQRVWLAGFKNLDSNITVIYKTLDEFMNAILARGSHTNTEFGFHNLKFDGSFILPWLYQNGYTVSHSKPQPGQFSILVDNRNNWYSLTVQVNSRRRVTLWDTNKLFPMPLEYVPDVYSTPTRKVIEDKEFYETKRDMDHEPTERELYYFENDLQVPAEALREHIKRYGLRFKKTQAGQSFYNFTESFKAWKWRFPALSTEQDAAIRPAYWGGVSYVPKKYVSLTHYNLRVFDINSSYPDKAANKKLPYGPCIMEYGEGKHPDMSKFWVAEVIADFTLKENCLPCIPMKAISEGRPMEDADKWVTDSQGMVKMVLSAIDYKTIHMSYDITIHRWKWTMHWAWKVQKEIQRFVYKNNDIKVGNKEKAALETDPQKKTDLLTAANRAKTDNNSFYGKFGEDIIKFGQTPYWDEADGISWEMDRKDEQSERARKYLPVAIAITAWGRQQLVQMANILGEHFLYCDTDSVHYLMAGHYKIEEASRTGIFEIHDTKLGAWSHEGDYVKGRYLRSKCYMEEKPDGTIEATVAGLPADPHTGLFSKSRSCLTWDNFHIGHIVTEDKANKLRPVTTRTGTKLLPASYTIKEKAGLFG